MNSAALFYPPLSAGWPYILLPGAFAEGALTLWLLLTGVNAAHWVQQGKQAMAVPA